MNHADKFPVGTSREISTLLRLLYNDPWALPNKLYSVINKVKCLNMFFQAADIFLHCSTNVSIGLGAMIELQFFKIHSINFDGIPFY